MECDARSAECEVRSGKRRKESVECEVWNVESVKCEVWNVESVKCEVWNVKGEV